MNYVINNFLLDDLCVELVFIGIGMFLCTAFVSLVTIKILQRREEDCDATSESGYKKLIDAGKTKGRLYGHGPEAGQYDKFYIK